MGFFFLRYWLFHNLRVLSDVYKEGGVGLGEWNHLSVVGLSVASCLLNNFLVSSTFAFLSKLKLQRFIQ